MKNDSRSKMSDVAAVRQRTFGAIDAAGQELAELADDLLKHPELAYQEKRTVQRIAALLSKHEIPLETGLLGLPTAFQAEIPGSSAGAPSVGIIAEYDALPEIGHGCGHNHIAASALGAVLGLKEALRHVEGRAILFGTPAEEANVEPGGAKVAMAEAGLFDALDATVMYHPYWKAFVDTGSRALVGLAFDFKGQAAHAAADPWNGRNALDGVLLTYANINALRQHVRDDVRIHGIITNGGEAPNIVPEHAAARFLLRCDALRDLQALRARVEDCARAAALATGTELRIHEFCRPYADIKANDPLIARVMEHMRSLGVDVAPAQPFEASTDFGNVSHACPATSFHLAITSGPVPWHSPEVVRASGTERAKVMTVIAAKILAAATIDIWVDQEFRREVRQAFEKAGA